MLETTTIQTKNGKELKINCASFGTEVKLCQTLIKCLKDVDIKPTQEMLNLTFADILNSPLLISALCKAFVNAVTSDDLNSIFWKCANHCTYNGLRITEELFVNSIEARADYFEIQFHVLKANITPFFPSLRSSLEKVA